MLQACRQLPLRRPTLATTVKPKASFGRQCCRPSFALAPRAPAATSLVKRLLSFPKRHPFWFQLGLNTAVVGGADLHTQILQGRRFGNKKPESERVDTQRLMLFALFGAMQAPVTWLVYINVFKVLFPRSLVFANMTLAQKLASRKGQIDVVKQAAFDCFVYVPLWFFPNFYLFKTALQGEKCHHPVDLLKGSLLRYQENFMADNLGYCVMWMPVNCLVFSVPVWLRLPTSIYFNYIFTVLLSHFRGASEQAA